MAEDVRCWPAIRQGFLGGGLTRQAYDAAQTATRTRMIIQWLSMREFVPDRSMLSWHIQYRTRHRNLHRIPGELFSVLPRSRSRADW